MGDKVVRCKKSNLRETWATLEGLPNPEKVHVIEEQISALTHHIRTTILSKKEYEDSQRIITSITSLPNQGVMPYWANEFRWQNKGEKILRIGNNFLGFHTLHKEEHKYRTYAEDLEPLIKEVTERINADNAFLVKRTIFRYINIFFLDREGFNLNEYFDVNCSIKLDNEPVPLSGFLANFSFNGLKNNTTLTLDFKAQPSNDKIFLIIETTGHQSLEKSVTISDQKILEVLRLLKEETKCAFFRCAKEKIKNILEVEYE